MNEVAIKLKIRYTSILENESGFFLFSLEYIPISIDRYKVT